MIRLAVPTIEKDDLEAVCAVLETGFLVQGSQVVAFEEMVANVVGIRHAIAVSNGTAALHLALLALDVRPGDLVVVTTYSWIATANVVELCGAQPVFVDIQPDTFNMDPHKLDETLRRLMSVSSTAKRVKAVLPVHTFGQMADMPNILEITSYYDLPVVEDAACALGASWQGRQAGSWGVMGCFSFHPRKAITTGEGGMVVTNDSSLARKLRILRNHGLDPDACAPEFVVPGFNYRITEFQAALGLTQMSKLKRIVIARRKLAKHYDELLKGSLLKSPYTPEGSDPVYQSYVVLLPEYIAPHRAELIAELKRQGIEAGIGTWHMPLTSYYRSRYGYRLGDFPATDDVFARSLALPMFETLSPSEQEKVVRAVMNLISEMD